MSKVKPHTAMDMYKRYKKRNPNSDVTYALYRHIIGEYNKKAIDKVLDGETLVLGARLGKLRIKRVERNFEKKRVDYFETIRLQKQGIDKTVYYVDNYWFRWYWDKTACNIPNKSVYQFKPTNGSTGNKKKLVKKLKSDEFAHTMYKP